MSLQEHAKIYTATEKCDEAFREYISNSRSKNPATATKLRVRLEVWDRYAGARAKERYRLDDRLEEAHVIRDVFLSSLSLITHHLNQGEHCYGPFFLEQEPCPLIDHTVNTGHTHEPDLLEIAANDDTDDSAGDKWVSQTFETYQGKPWGEIAVAISNLFLLMKRVREIPAAGLTDGVPSGFRRADDAYFQGLCRVLARSKFQHARSTLTDLVGDSIFSRRRRLLYRRHRLNRQSSSVEARETSRELRPGRLSSEGHMFEDEQPEQEEFRGEITDARIVSSQPTTGITRLPRNQVVRILRQKTEASGSIRGQSVAIQDSLEYPPIPKSDPGTDHICCEYCDEPLDKSISEDDWK